MIHIDADACPVKEICINIAKIHNEEVTMYSDTSHILYNEYAKIVICDKGFDSADLKIVNNLKKNDIVITNDYGLASNAIAKCSRVISFNGTIIDQNNIDILLNIRYISAKERKKSNHIKGPKKRCLNDDIEFQNNFKKLLEEKTI